MSITRVMGVGYGNPWESPQGIVKVLKESEISEDHLGSWKTHHGLRNSRSDAACLYYAES